MTIEDPGWPEVPRCHVEASARFKKLFVPVLYEPSETDSLERRMLMKIYNIAATAKHRGDGVTADELRAIHSAAYAGVDGPDPEFGEVAVPARAHQEEKEDEMPLTRSATTEIRDPQPAAVTDAGDQDDCAGTEVCICAAIEFADGRIVRGHRHDSCFRTAEGWTPKPDSKGHVQGFITSRNRFVDRNEGTELQNAAGIASAQTGRSINGVLFSEDLYFDAWEKPFNDPIVPPSAAPDAGAPQERAEKKERPEPINTETLRNIRVWLATMKRLAAPPSAVDYVELLLNEVEYLRAYVPPPPSAPAAHQETPEPMTEGRFRKKPVVIEAVHYIGGGNVEPRGAVPDWLWDALANGTAHYVNGGDPLRLRTLEGYLTVSPGDWIIRGIKGELYHCKPDIFAATYEPEGAPAPAAHQETPERQLLTPKAGRYEEVRRDVLKTILDDNDRMHAELEGAPARAAEWQPLDKVTRVEVIDETGRVFTRWDCSVQPSFQDGGRTLKLFIGLPHGALAGDSDE